MFRVGPGELTILMLFGIPIIAILGGVFISALKIFKGDSAKGDSAHDADEAYLIQNINMGMSRLEERVEALETLLMDGAAPPPIPRRSDSVTNSKG